jgi:hypothetical protein
LPLNEALAIHGELSRVSNNSVQIEFKNIEPYITLFISKAVSKSQRNRWTQFAKSIDQLSLKFNSLWKGLDKSKATCSSAFELSNQDYIYLDLDLGGKYGVVLNSINAQEIMDSPKDAMLFSVDKSHAIFLTHESEHYLFVLGKV